MHAYSIMIITFSVLMFFAGVAIYNGQTGWLKSFNWAKYKDRAAYAKFLGKVIMFLSLIMLVSGLIGFLSVGIALIVLVAGFAFCIAKAINKAKEHY